MFTQLNWPKNLIIKKFEQLDSTNDEAKRLALRDSNNYLIIAETQTKGRGRSGKAWVSESGNLYFSLLLKENYPLAYLNAFPSIVSLSIADALYSCGIEEQKIKLKWPNDILINAKKIAGILLESKINSVNNSFDYLIIGCGVNIVTHPQIVNYQTTSFYDEQNQIINKDLLLDILLKIIYKYINCFEKNGLQEIISLWRQKEWGIGNKVSLSLKDKELKGVYKGVNADGKAEIENEKGELFTINSGEIFFN